MKIAPILFIALLYSSISYAEFNYSAYKDSTMSSAIAALNLDQKTDVLIEAGSFKYTVTVTYTGNHRNTIAPIKEFIAQWVHALGKPKEYLELFPFEVEIEQNGVKYWLPIQSTLVEPFANEIEPGKSVTLRIMALGAVKRTPMFAINEFSAK